MTTATNHRVDVWWALHSDLSPEDIQRATGGDEVERAAQFATDRLAQRFLVGRALTRLILARELGVAPADIAISRQCPSCEHPTHGKPVLVGTIPLWFSLSRTDQAVAVAVSREGNVGCDIVAITAPTGETEAVDWAWREAATKCDGRGLALDPWALLKVGDRITLPDRPNGEHFATDFSLPDTVGVVVIPDVPASVHVHRWVTL